MYVLPTVYVEHLHKKYNTVVLVHGLEIPSLPTRECTFASFHLIYSPPCSILVIVRQLMRLINNL